MGGVFFAVLDLFISSQVEYQSEKEIYIIHLKIFLQVRDTGRGISPQDIPLVFTKFAEAQPTSNRSTGGEGLGLAICRRYVSNCKFGIILCPYYKGFFKTSSFYLHLSVPCMLLCVP